MRLQHCLRVVSLVAISSGLAWGQTIPELARARPVNPVVRGVLRDVTTAPLETLSSEATLIVVGRLLWTRSYLTSDEMNILTDYAIQPDRVLRGSLPVTQNAPGRSATPTLTVYGGEVIIDGVKVAAVDHNMDLPASDHSYLFFLKPFGTEPGRYEAVRGALFELQNGRMRALLKRADTPAPYKDITDLPLSAAVEEIARRVRR